MPPSDQIACIAAIAHMGTFQSDGSRDRKWLPGLGVRRSQHQQSICEILKHVAEAFRDGKVCALHVAAQDENRR